MEKKEFVNPFNSYFVICGSLMIVMCLGVFVGYIFGLQQNISEQTVSGLDFLCDENPELVDNYCEARKWDVMKNEQQGLNALSAGST